MVDVAFVKEGYQDIDIEQSDHASKPFAVAKLPDQFIGGSRMVRRVLVGNDTKRRKLPVQLRLRGGAQGLVDGTTHNTLPRELAHDGAQALFPFAVRDDASGQGQDVVVNVKSCSHGADA